ncbi:CAAX prenyl protease 1, putative [Fulvivirga imtechensis AK7]|uniref:CAAX prenyl protease 1, putative n=1 Tax=Fulvivirga imtechensis AK7 TaxID=1237149 RepID=L8JRA7_9BACT|nr:M48 family metallopeptidase [Fulvivirga imtechensis]ELR70029.1 CAAX prenyl protease 1, putative [Fulvivirga imtechensis AK7]
MTPESILTIVLIIITADFLLEQVLEYINLRSAKDDIPDDIAAFYDRNEYKRSREYQRTLTRFSFLTATFSFIVSFLLLITGGFGYIDELLRPFFENEIYLALSYFGILFLASDLLNTPFEIYQTFVIEEKYGFNKTTPKIFIMDKLKGYLLTIAIGGLLIGLLLYLILNIGESFWVYFWVVAALFILFVNMFYTSLVLPLFNKLTPLGEGELKTAIENYSRKVNFPLDNIFVIDGSKRSKKANAFFSGIGKRKKIVLYDTLIENHSTDELVAILAHEVGHFKKKHIIGSFIFSILQIGIMLFIMSRMIYNENLSLALGAEQMGVHLNLLAFGILYSPISKVLGIISNVISRKNEFEADAYAGTTYGGSALAASLKKLSVDNLSNLYPHPAYVFMYYSHPPLLKRLGALKNQ